MTRIASSIVAVLIVSSHAAFAFWGSDVPDNGSGLDLAGGYDTNTVSSIHGTVLTAPARREASRHTEMTVTIRQGTVTVLLGPWDYWIRQDFNVRRDQEISVTGSKAQGKDGSIYLFAQKLENITAGTALTLRSEAGVPGWSRGNAGAGGVGQNSLRSTSGAGPGYRGGGMRGGGRR